MNLEQALVGNVRTWILMKRLKATSGKTTRVKVPRQNPGAEEPIVAFEVSVMEMERRGSIVS